MLTLALGRATAMARTPAGLPAGIRLTDHISLGVIARTFPIEEVREVLAETGRASERERDLPAHVVVYYAIALALYAGSGTREVLRCLLEGLRWLWGAEAVRVAGKSGISQARTRLGEAPLRRLYERVVRPVATRATKGAWYRAWRLVSLDGSCLDVADTAAAPAAELAALCHERWEVEGALAELKTHLRGARMVLRSKTPELVRQEFWGLLLAHFAVRGLMHEAALRADEDPDRLSFLHAVRVVRRKLPVVAALSPSGEARPARGGAGRDPGGARGGQPRPAGAARGQTQDERLQAAAARPAAHRPDRLRCRY